MKIFFQATCLLLLATSCATSGISQDKNVVSNNEVSTQQRMPAMHNYAGSSCSNAQFDLNYDGPGSNYAFGGFSNLYIKKQTDSSGKPLALLAYENIEGDYMKIGEDFGQDRTLQIIFSEIQSKKTSKTKITPKKGQKCTPGEYDYQHAQWNADTVVKIDEISSEASQKTGLKAGSKLNFHCEKSTDTPITCPASGHY